MAFDPVAVTAKAVTLGLHRAAVMIASKSEGPGPQMKAATKKLPECPSRQALD